MSVFRIATVPVTLEVVADDELDALSQASDASLLIDGDEGNVETLPDPDVEDYEPERPG